MRIGEAFDVVSIHSGLTSSECETTMTAQHARTATPTDFFPVISMMAGGGTEGGGMGIGGDDPPMVSPISLDGSFDYCTEEEEGDDEEHPLNVTMESTIATDDDEEEAYRRLSPPVLERRAKSDGDYFVPGGEGRGGKDRWGGEGEGKEKEIKKKRSPVFFDIGKPFADNAMFPTLADSPVADSSEGATTTPRSGSASATREERICGGRSEGGPRLPSALSPPSFVSALPPPSFVSAASSRGSGRTSDDGGASRLRQWTRGAASSRRPPTSRWVPDSDARDAKGASFVAHSIDGEVITFEEIEDYSRAGGGG
jgi:hypothetical protein